MSRGAMPCVVRCFTSLTTPLRSVSGPLNRRYWNSPAGLLGPGTRGGFGGRPGIASMSARAASRIVVPHRTEVLSG